MTGWTPCPLCGADGYTIRPFEIGWGVFCPNPDCDTLLTYGPTRTDAIMHYTAVHRIRKEATA